MNASLPTPDMHNTEDVMNTSSTGRGLQTAEIGVQTDWSIPHVQTKSEAREGEWIFMEPRKTIEHSSRAAKLLNQTALKRLRRFPPLRQEDRASLIETLCSCNASEVAEKLMQSPLRGSILLEIIYDIENCARENCTRNSVLHGASYGGLCEFSWDNVIEELLTQQPLLAEILLAVTLPTCKIGNSKATNSLVPVIGAIHGMLMKQRFHELSLVQKVVSVTLANEQTHQKVNSVQIDSVEILFTSVYYCLFMHILLCNIKFTETLSRMYNLILTCSCHTFFDGISKVFI